jgi:hypothetical protein
MRIRRIAVQFVVQQGGRIHLVRNGTVLPTDFLDLTRYIVSAESRVFWDWPSHPTAGGRFYVNFTNPAGNTVVARFRRSPIPDRR